MLACRVMWEVAFGFTINAVIISLLTFQSLKNINLHSGSIHVTKCRHKRHTLSNPEDQHRSRDIPQCFLSEVNAGKNRRRSNQQVTCRYNNASSYHCYSLRSLKFSLQKVIIRGVRKRKQLGTSFSSDWMRYLCLEPHCLWLFMCGYSGQQCCVKDVSSLLLFWNRRLSSLGRSRV